MADIESEAEFEATEAAYQRWLADYGHKLASDGLGRHLFWAGWLARKEYERAESVLRAADPDEEV